MTKFPKEHELKKMRNMLSKGPASRMLSPTASELDRLKHKLCEQFVKYKQKHDLSQKQLAKILEVDEALVSKILHYHVEQFTIDRLVRHLTRIYPKLSFVVRVA